MKNLTKAEKLVNELGKKTPDGIARFLQSKRIKGYPEDARSCPINRYFSRELKIAHDRVVVLSDHIQFENRLYTARNKVNINKNIRKFIANFDKDKYPKLIKE